MKTLFTFMVVLLTLEISTADNFLNNVTAGQVVFIQAETAPDETPPTITIENPVTDGQGFLTNNTSVAVNGSATDNVGVSSVTVSNATTSTSYTVSGTTSWSTTATGLASGANTIVARAYDAAGNPDFETIYLTNDSTPPSITIQNPVTDGGGFSTNSSSVGIAGIASDNIHVASVSVSNATIGLSYTVTGTTTWSATVTNLSAGANTIIARALDDMGQVDYETVYFTNTTGAGGYQGSHDHAPVE